MKYIYKFEEGSNLSKELLGGKGANLAKMSTFGLPIPDGFTISTTACKDYYKNDKKMLEELKKEILESITLLEEKTGKGFGSIDNPLLVSVRSGAPVSMPGMMDTILNVGLNDEIVKNINGDMKRYIYDSYRRLIEMYSEVVKGLEPNNFSGYITKYKEIKGYTSDLELTENDLINIVKKLQDNYLEESGEYFPQDVYTQLLTSVEAVFSSWNNKRAIKYRKIYGVSDELGTAVNIQEMVNGNKNTNSATGVVFSRNPMSGINEITGEFLINAQGEDIVAGVRTPDEIKILEKKAPKIYSELCTYIKKMEKYFKDMQDMEFTIESGKLFILQTRNGKRTPFANAKITLDLLDEGLIDEKECLLRLNSEDVEALLSPSFKTQILKKSKALTSGIATSPGAFCGHPVFSSEEAKERKNENIILVREETSADDIEGMNYAGGILTVTGGFTSHAAVVARSLGKTAICGASELKIDINKKCIYIGKEIITSEDYISIDGNTGNIYKGKLDYEENNQSNLEIIKRIETLITKYKGIPVRANADTLEGVKTALKYGAEGIGLVRTEHMFFNEKRIIQMRKLIIAKSNLEREAALKELEKFQEKDFYEILKEMNSYPVVVRYLDPPLHEFLPKDEKEISLLAKDLKIDEESLINQINCAKEVNPMMGLRGARLLIKYPEIIEMQTRALIKSALKLEKEGIIPNVEIMVPLITDLKEFVFIKKIIKNIADELINNQNSKLSYKIGTMIETPRAVLLSNVLSKYANFYSFGTNDLTQLTYGISRDDSSKFLNDYLEKDLYKIDPFKTLDIYGVGSLMSIAKKTASRKIEMGICGEHGADEESINFCTKLGLDYVSCSPYKVLGARLSASKSRIKNEK